METIDEKVSRCKELLQNLNYFNGNVFLAGKLKGLQILSLDNEGNVTVNIDEEKLHDFWQSYKTYYSMTVDGKVLYRVLLSMFGDTEHTDDEILENIPSFDGYMYIGGTVGKPLLRITSTGELDTTFNPEGTKSVKIAKVLTDNRILCVDVDNKIIRYDVDGTFDTTFTNNTIIGDIFELTPDEKIIATQVSGDDVKIVRFNRDGTIDTSFTSLNFIGGAIKSINVQYGQNGKILVGGSFDHYGATTTPTRLVRLNVNGSLDETFIMDPSTLPSGTFTVNRIDIVASNSLCTYIIGNYTQATSKSGVIRMNADGSFITELWYITPDTYYKKWNIDESNITIIQTVDSTGTLSLTDDRGQYDIMLFPETNGQNLNDVLSGVYEGPTIAVGKFSIRGGQFKNMIKFTYVRHVNYTLDETFPKQSLKTYMDSVPNFEIKTITIS